MERLQVLQDYYNTTVDERLSQLVKVKCIPGQKQTTIGFSVSNPSSQSIYNVPVNLSVTSDAEGKTKRIPSL